MFNILKNLNSIVNATKTRGKDEFACRNKKFNNTRSSFFSRISEFIRLDLRIARRKVVRVVEGLSRHGVNGLEVSPIPWGIITKDYKVLSRPSVRCSLQTTPVRNCSAFAVRGQGREGERWWAGAGRVGGGVGRRMVIMGEVIVETRVWRANEAVTTEYDRLAILKQRIY